MNTKKQQSTHKTARKQAVGNNNRLQNDQSIQKLRVIQPNLVFVNGLSSDLSQKDILETEKYFGRYGKVLKTIVNPQTPYKKNFTYQAYVTYQTQLQASLAIVALDGFKLYSDRPLKVSYGTTKYCMNFLKGNQCLNNDCFYLHQIDRKRQVVNEDPKNTIFKQQNDAAFDMIIANLQEIVRISLVQNVNLDQDWLQGFPTVTQVIQFLIDSRILQTPDVEIIKKKILEQRQGLSQKENKTIDKDRNKTSKNNNQTTYVNKNIQTKNISSTYHEKNEKRQYSPEQPKLVKSNSFSTTCSPAKTQELYSDQVSSVVQPSQLQQADNHIVTNDLKEEMVKLYIKQQSQDRYQTGILQLQWNQRIQRMLVKQIVKTQKELKSRFEFANNSKCRNFEGKQNWQVNRQTRNDCKIFRGIVQRHLLAKN